MSLLGTLASSLLQEPGIDSFRFGSGLKFRFSGLGLGCYGSVLQHKT